MGMFDYGLVDRRMGGGRGGGDFFLFAKHPDRFWEPTNHLY
jgi:hypothetical protein